MWGGGISSDSTCSTSLHEVNIIGCCKCFVLLQHRLSLNWNISDKMQKILTELCTIRPKCFLFTLLNRYFLLILLGSKYELRIVLNCTLLRMTAHANLSSPGWPCKLSKYIINVHLNKEIWSECIKSDMHKKINVCTPQQLSGRSRQHSSLTFIFPLPHAILQSALDRQKWMRRRTEMWN